jgi:hypothetical protein
MDLYLGKKRVIHDGKVFKTVDGAYLGETLSACIENLEQHDKAFGAETVFKNSSWIHKATNAILAKEHEGIEVAKARLNSLKKTISN